jgi:delta 1-pyrroline-5-carboxylate dehydrogenase
MTNPDSSKTGVEPHGSGTVHDRKDHHELDADALMALEQARKLQPGPERAEAMKRAGVLRQAADLREQSLPKRRRPRKT